MSLSTECKIPALKKPSFGSNYRVCLGLLFIPMEEIISDEYSKDTRKFLKKECANEEL